MARRAPNKYQRPPLADGQRVGLFGGSFNPPHQGHVLLAHKLRTILQLDLVWWLVAKQNPLKQSAPMNINERVDACRALAGGHKIYISDEERALNTQYSVDTICALQHKYPKVHFIWLMGADNLKNFHHWHRWADIFYQLPIAVYPRPRETIKAGLAPAAQRFALQRLPHHQAQCLIKKPLPCWVMLESPLNPLSSTKIRAEA